MNLKPIVPFILFMIALFTTPVATAASTFPERIAVESHQLERIGFGTARYVGVVQIYDAALYAPSREAAAEILDGATPKRLEIVYHRPIEAGMMIQAAQRTLERQHGADMLHRWQPQIESLHAAYRDVAAGDRFALVTAPGRGLWLEFNGQERVRIADDEFARLYFGIWLGEEPLSASLREALLPAGCCPSVAVD